MTTLQVRRATVRSRLSIVEIDDNGNRTRYIAENVIEDYAQKLAAAPELLEACRDAANQLRTVAALLNHIPPKYAAAISPMIRYGDIDTAIIKAEAQK